MDFKASFFQLQLDFARRIAQVKDWEFSESLLEYTPIFRFVGADEAVWQAYLEGFDKAENQADFTADFVQKHRFISKREYFGCFAYALEENDTQLRIHFDNIEGSGALSKERIGARQSEIKALL